MKTRDKSKWTFTQINHAMVVLAKLWARRLLWGATEKPAVHGDDLYDWPERTHRTTKQAFLTHLADLGYLTRDRDRLYRVNASAYDETRAICPDLSAYPRLTYYGHPSPGPYFSAMLPSAQKWVLEHRQDYRLLMPPPAGVASWVPWEPANREAWQRVSYVAVVDESLEQIKRDEEVDALVAANRKRMLDGYSAEQFGLSANDACYGWDGSDGGPFSEASPEPEQWHRMVPQTAAKLREKAERLLARAQRLERLNDLVLTREGGWPRFVADYLADVEQSCREYLKKKHGAQK